MHEFKARLLAGVTVWAAGCGAVVAQDITGGQRATPPASTGAPAEGVQVQELVVTAQKREQSRIEVPFALTAYTGEFLDKIGVQQFDQLSAFVPGFLVQNQSPNNPGFVIRGITSDSGDSTAEPRVSVYQDGVSISKPRGSFIELFDDSRIEIAKGPQSTLFGRGALIGAVNIIQNKADPSKFDYAARAEGGDYGYAMGEGMINLPLNDTLAVRVSGRVKVRDGYVDNLTGGEDFNSVDTHAGRLSIGWKPNDRLRSDFIVNYESDRPSGTSFKSNTFNPTDPVTGAVLGDRAPLSYQAAIASPAGFEGSSPLGLRRVVWGATEILDWRVTDQFRLSSITAYRHFQDNENFDPDGTALNIFAFAEDARDQQYSQELRLNWDGGGRWSGFVGGSVFGESGRQHVPGQIDERLALALLTGQISRPNPQPLALLTNPQFDAALLQGLAGASRVALSGAQALAIANNLQANHQEQTTNFDETTSYDAFADLTFHVTPKLELSGGLRYTYDDKTSRISASELNGRSILGGVIGALGQPAAVRTALLGALAVPGAATIPTTTAYPVPLFGLVTQPTAGNGAKQAAGLTDDGVTFRFAARYAVSPTFDVYANYARGRRPEVLSVAAPSAPLGAARFTPVSSEKVDSYEVGAKTLQLGRRLSLEGSGYFYEYNNFQTTVQQGTMFLTTNAGSATSYGFEGQATYKIATVADVFATYSYNHSRFGDGLYKGDSFRLSPDHRWSLGASLRHEALGGLFEFTPTVTWQSKTFFDDDNDIPALQVGHLLPDLVQDEFQKAYGLVNLRLSYRPGSGPWKFEVFANNVADQRFVKDAGNTGDTFGIPTFIAGEPRFVGVAVSFRR